MNLTRHEVPLQAHGVDAHIDAQAPGLHHRRLDEEVARVDKREAAHLTARLARYSDAYCCNNESLNIRL